VNENGWRTIGALLIVPTLMYLPLARARWTMIALAPLVVSFNLVVNRLVNRGKRGAAWFSLVGFATMVFASLLAPNLSVPVMVLLTANIAFVTRWLGRKYAIAAMALTLVLMASIAIAHHEPSAAGGIFLWAFSAACTIGIIGDASEAGARLATQYTRVIDGLGLAVWEGNVDYVTSINIHVAALLGIPAAAISSTADLRRPMHPDDRHVLDFHRAQIAANQDHEMQYRAVHADGSTRWLLELIRVQEAGQDDVPAQVQGVIIDVTERMEAENRVAMYANLVESVGLGMVIIGHGEDRVLRVNAANPAMASFSTRDPEQLVNLPVADAFSEVFDEGMIRSLSAVADGGDIVELGPTRVQGDGVRYVRLRAFPLAGHAAAITMEDATAFQLANAALSYQTNHDALTGLPNRPNVVQRLNEALETVPNDRHEVSLVMIDLDHFRQVNDTFGHHEGDRLLIELGRRLKRAGRTEVVARLGGDEFAIVVTGVNAAIRADALAETVLEVFLEAFVIQDINVQTTAAIGIATFPTDASDATSLLQRAELAMYEAKKSADRIMHYVATEDESSPSRLALLADFQHAVSEGELTNHYQPIFDLTTGALVGGETLVRWQHPDHGLLAPAQFITLAEQSGMVGSLTEAVAAAAIADAARWHRLGTPMPVTINLSGRSLQDHRTTSQLLHLLDLADLPASALRVEVTEQSLLDDPITAAKVLSQLRSQGAEVSIDDFGTGYSSLSLLRQLPIDELKIDGTFVAGLCSQDAMLVRSIIDLGHALGLRVVAEGIESQEELDVLIGLGCDRGQGFFFGQPMPADAFADLLTTAPKGFGTRRPALTQTGATVTQLSSRRTAGPR
jgi:diguanylate cyclase (GGDEF)-like protein/PAS domain S-box-containing protein